jgi:hypothetical protein
MVAINLQKEPFDVRIDRKSKWGNPFVMGRDGNRDDVCEKHKAWLWQEIKAVKVSMHELAALKGKKLGCHCAPLRCHGDTLSSAVDWAHSKLTTQS